MFPDWRHWDGKYTRKGMVKLALGRILKVWMFLSVVYAAVFAVRNGKARSRKALMEIVSRIRTLMRGGLGRLATAL
jgi:hypothetical protein